MNKMPHLLSLAMIDAFVMSADGVGSICLWESTHKWLVFLPPDKQFSKVEEVERGVWFVLITLCHIDSCLGRQTFFEYWFLFLSVSPQQKVASLWWDGALVIICFIGQGQDWGLDVYNRNRLTSWSLCFVKHLYLWGFLYEVSHTWNIANLVSNCLNGK